MNTIPKEVLTTQQSKEFNDAFAWDAYTKYVNAERVPHDIIPEASNHWERNNANPN